MQDQYTKSVVFVHIINKEMENEIKTRHHLLLHQRAPPKNKYKTSKVLLCIIKDDLNVFKNWKTQYLGWHFSLKSIDLMQS